jgi:hypothetical protein
MNSNEWLACREPDDMILILLRRGERQESRKFQLFSCGFCRQNWHLLVDERSRRAVEVAERQADDCAGVEEVGEARARAFRALAHFGQRSVKGRLAMAATRLFSPGMGFAGMTARIAFSIRRSSRSPRREVMAMAQADLLRDLFGNPFHPEDFDPDWLTPTVLELSRDIYDHRGYEKMPFLGDALEEAGCANPRVLEHCRAGPAHARGCWVLDALTGRSGT